MNGEILKNFEFHAAGRVWMVPEFHLDRMPDGTVGASMAEFDRVHRSIANVICGTTGPLTTAEFEFLCDVSDVPYVKVARFVGLDRSSLTKWMQTERPMRIGRSNTLKQWFLIRMFGDRIGRFPIRVRDLAHAEDALRELHDKVVRSGAAGPVRELGAAVEVIRTRYRPATESAVSGSIAAFELAPAPNRVRREGEARL